MALPPEPLYDPALDDHVEEMRAIADAVSFDGPGDVELTPKRLAAVRRFLDDFIPTDTAVTDRST